MPSGTFFIPFSFADGEKNATQPMHRRFNDGSVLAFYYNRIVKKGRDFNNENDYPVSVVIGPDYVSFYAHAHRSEEIEKGEYFASHYGVGRLYSFSFAEGHTKNIDRWFETNNPCPKDILDCNLYESISTPRVTLNFADAYTPKPDGLKLKDGGKEDPDHVFSWHRLALDFLYDLFHSNVFEGHSGALRLQNAFRSAPLGRAVLAKAEYCYAKKSWENGKSITDKKDQLESISRQYDESVKTWLGIIREEGSEGIIHPEKGLIYSDHSVQSRTGWFQGIEAEHLSVYKGKKQSNGGIFKKETEESIQWLINRYDFWNASKFQIFLIYESIGWILISFLLLTAICFYLAWEWLELKFDSTNKQHYISAFFGVLFLGGASFIAERFLRLFLFTLNIFPWFRRKKWIPHDAFDILLSIPKIIKFNSPEILLASSVVWGIFTKYEETINEYIKQQEFWYYILVLLSLLFCILFSFGKFSRFLPSFNKREKVLKLLGRSVFLLFLVTVYSFIFGSFTQLIKDRSNLDSVFILLLSIIAASAGIIFELGFRSKAVEK